jgi:tetratricopeptide (TPR) repeat protein
MSTPATVSPAFQTRDRVFVSYSHLDKEWLDKLREVLLPDIRNGRIDYRDDRNLAPGDDWYQEIVQYVARARVAVLLVSANFLASRFIMDQELPLILEAEGHGLTILWAPLSGKYYGQDALPGAERVTRYQAVWDANQPLDTAPEPSREQHLLDLCKLIARLVGAARPPNNLPFTPLGDLLKGREDDLVRLDEQLRLHGASAIVQPQAVSGPGGIGKTRLAVEYARRHEGDFSALLFVSAGSPPDLDANMARLCAADGALDLTEYKSASQDDQYAAVIRWLQQNKGWLLILDNVDTRAAADAVKKLVAKLTGGHVLITSRITMWSGGIPRFPLDVLSPDAAVALLIDKANSLPRTPRPDDARQAGLLAEQLGYLPLALTHAAAYIGESDLAFEDYLKEFDHALQSDEEDLIEYDSNPENAKILKTVATTYFLSIDRLGPMEKAILRAACFLAPAPIPIAMFADCPDEMKALVDLWCEETGEPGDTKSVRDAVKELVRYSLIDRSAETFTIHRMERLVLAHRAHKDHQDRVPRWIEATRAAMICYAPDDTAEDPKTWPVWDVLRPHAEALVQYSLRDRLIESDLALLNALGQFYYGKAKFEESLAMDEEALQAAKKLTPRDDGQIAHRYLSLGESLRQVGRLKEAEAAFRESLDIRLRSGGPKSIKVAVDLNYLASVIHEQGRSDESESLHRQAIEILETHENEECEGDFAKSLNNLGGMLHAKGNLDEAEILFRRAIPYAEAGFGSDNPKTLVCITNLARLLADKGDHGAAKEYFLRAVQGCEKALGLEHPITASVRAYYGAFLLEMGSTNEAVELLKESYENLCRKRVEGNVGRLNAGDNLAAAFRRLGQAAEAEQVDRQVVAGTEGALGKDHPRTRHRRNNLIADLLLLEKIAEAKAVLEQNQRAEAMRFANITPRVAFFAYLLAVVEGRDAGQPLGRLKTLLTGPEFPIASGVRAGWRIDSVIDRLRPRLPSAEPEFLAAVAEAINDRANLTALDSFPAWHDQPPVPLDVPWPDEADGAPTPPSPENAS